LPQFTQAGHLLLTKAYSQIDENHGIAAKRRYIITTDSKHDLLIADNKLDQDFIASKADEK
jgi:hypothetical protein